MNIDVKLFLFTNFYDALLLFQVDHSIVESFAQGGRACITSRVYPTEAIYNSARVFVFNNATGARVTAKSIKVWQMNAAVFDESTFQE